MNFFTIKQAAEILGVKAHRIKYLILTHQVRPTKLVRDWVFDEKELEDLRDYFKKKGDK